MLKKISNKLRTQGIQGLLSAATLRAFPPRAACHKRLIPFIQDRPGLEIGGPSPPFGQRGCFPVYPIAARIDNCTFSQQTVWEGAIAEGQTYHFDQHKSPGRQFICEASDLSEIDSDTYDFVLSSHVLEHLANPLEGLAEWKRVLKPGGVLVLIVPDPRHTFDHRRPITSLEHLQIDLQKGEDDLTHLEEILALHDLSRDPLAGSVSEFRARSLKNEQNRCLHHHVFDLSLVKTVLMHLELTVFAVQDVEPCHLFAVAQKP